MKHIPVLAGIALLLSAGSAAFAEPKRIVCAYENIFWGGGIFDFTYDTTAGTCVTKRYSGSRGMEATRDAQGKKFRKFTDPEISNPLIEQVLCDAKELRREEEGKWAFRTLVTGGGHTTSRTLVDFPCVADPELPESLKGLSVKTVMDSIGFVFEPYVDQ
jgi:hypothetical protein